jgi:hypothetical protein
VEVETASRRIDVDGKGHYCAYRQQKNSESESHDRYLQWIDNAQIIYADFSLSLPPQQLQQQLLSLGGQLSPIRWLVTQGAEAGDEDPARNGSEAGPEGGATPAAEMASTTFPKIRKAHLEAVIAGWGRHHRLVMTSSATSIALPMRLYTGFPKPQPRSESFSLRYNHRDIGQLNFPSCLR